MNSIARWFGRSLFVASFLFALPAAHALVVYGNPAGHDANPGGGLPWDNVGDNGVYLGAFDSGHWVITANHVGAVGISLDGTTYAAIAGSAQRIGTTDLLLYRIDTSLAGAPALSNLTLADGTPTVGAPVVLVGDGGDGIMRWGTNTVEQYATYALTQGGPTTIGMITDYDPVTGETQGQGGDSGGAVFFEYAPDQWLLTGIMSAIATVEGTQLTLSVALGFYHSQILAVVIPEPTAWSTYAGLAMLGFCAVRRRRCTRF